jgi:16S rRNA (uracil1498-N3)-methyltransferase
VTRLQVPVLPSDGDVPLGAEEVRHAIRVKRLTAGCEVVLFDGTGREARATLMGGSETWRATLLEPPHPGRTGAALTLCYALAKGEKLDTVVRQSTELGVGRIVLLNTARSVVRLDAARADKRVARLERVAGQAARQSGRADVPELLGPWTVSEATENVTEGSRWIMHPEAGVPVQTANAAGPLSVAVGPEGGFAPEELTLFVRTGWQQVTLSGPVLRTETAAVVSCALALHRMNAL